MLDMSEDQKQNKKICPAQSTYLGIMVQDLRFLSVRFVCLRVDGLVLESTFVIIPSLHPGLVFELKTSPIVVMPNVQIAVIPVRDKHLFKRVHSLALVEEPVVRNVQQKLFFGPANKYFLEAIEICNCNWANR